MNKDEFAQSIKNKYPQYESIDNDELATKILDKYPVYRSQVDEKSAIRKVGDFFTESTQKFGKTLGTAASVIDPTIKKQREESAKSGDALFKKAIETARDEEDPEKAKKLLESAKNLADTSGIDIFSNPEYQKTAKQVFGEGFGTFLEGASFGTFGGASKAPTLVKPLLSKGLKEGVKSGAKIGGAFGAGFGISEAMQEDKSIKDIAKSGIAGGLIGGAGGGAIGGVAGGISKLGRFTSSKVTKLTPIIRNKISESAYTKLNDVSRDLMKMSPTAAKNEAKWNKNTPKFLVDEGIIQLVESDGRKINTQGAISSIREKYGAESSAFSSVLKDSGEYVSLNKLRDRSISNLSNLKNRGSDYKKAIKQVEDEIASFKENFAEGGLVQNGDLLVNIADFNRIKSGLWAKTSNFNPTMADKLSSDINYKMGQVAKGLIEDTLVDTNIKSMNARLGDFASAIRVLENAEGKVLPGSFFGKQFTRLAGTVAGTPGGIPGSIIGNITGGVLADIMVNPQIKTGVLTKLLQKLNKTDKGRSIVSKAAEVLKKRGEERASRKLLTEAKSIQLKPSKDSSGILSQEEATGLLIDSRFERAKGLSPKDQEIETKAFNKIIRQEEQILNEVRAERGKVVNTDDYRIPFKDVGYNGANAASVQEPASYLAKKAFTKGLENPEKFATILAGGSGTGKTSAVKDIGKIKNVIDNSAVVLDSNLSSLNSALKKIKEAEKAGKTIYIPYVYREPVDSFVNGVVKRMKTNKAEGGRIVPSKITAGNHVDSWNVVKKLHNDGYMVEFIDNSLGAKNAKIVSFGELNSKIKYPSKEKLTDIFNKEAKKLHDAGEITTEQYKAYIQ